MKTITRKSLLYRTNVEYGDYTINHVLGCAHGCLFRVMHLISQDDLVMLNLTMNGLNQKLYRMHWKS